ncbi:Hypothetical protein A7982_08066 [Minicystis rosea]|nr:Hypothetical protein A7982_08066 [Minicystis rosea]
MSFGIEARPTLLVVGGKPASRIGPDVRFFTSDRERGFPFDLA